MNQAELVALRSRSDLFRVDSQPLDREGDHSHRTVQITRGIESLRCLFPDADAINDMNFVLFSTSGVHGSYSTLEDCERSMDGDGLDEEGTAPTVTVLIVKPRLVCLYYGNVEVTRENLPYLRGLRAKSHAVIANIGQDRG